MALEKGLDLITVSLKRQLENRKCPRAGEENEGEELSLDTRLISSVRRILESKIEFENAPGYSSTVQNNLKGKYKILAPPKKVSIDTSTKVHPVNLKIKNSANLYATKPNDVGSSPKKISVAPAKGDPSCPPIPSVSLYPESAVKLGWEGSEPVGAGMINMGNTCYLNSTLQALFHVPSFCNWLTSETIHNGTGKCDQAFVSGDMCTICAMAATLRIARSQSGNVIKPVLIYGRLRSICKHLSHGHQEDAHEFLRFLIESMERTFLLRFKGKKLDNLTKETTPLHRIFGGYLRNEVACHSCGKVSTTFQLFQDLFLDIRQSNSLLESMQAFFSRERLEGDESRSDCYKCEKCKHKGNCTKRVYVQIPPKVLCIQLKRFTALGKKIMKHISYPLKLDLSPYVYIKMTNQNGNAVSPMQNLRRPIPYKLVSIVSHYGSTMNCGHYTAVGKSAKGSYCIFDDSQVRPVSLNSALGASAYILMYEMEPGWHIGLESRGNHNIEKINNGSLKSMNSFVKPLGLSNNIQNVQSKTLVKYEVKSSSSSKPVLSPLQSEHAKVLDSPLMLKSLKSEALKSSSSSNVESNFRKPSSSHHENTFSISKSPECLPKVTLNGWLNKETSTTSTKSPPLVSISPKGSKSNFTCPLLVDKSKQSPLVIQKQLLLPKFLDVKTPNGVHTSTLKAKNNEPYQKQLKTSNSALETSCSQDPFNIKQQIPPVAPSTVPPNNSFRKECVKNSKSRNSNLLKRSHSSSLCSEDSKQSTPVRKKQLTLPSLLNAKNNLTAIGAHSMKTSSRNKAKTLKDWLEDRNPVAGMNAGNELKQSYQVIATKSPSAMPTVVSTVGGWKVTEHNSSNISNNCYGLGKHHSSGLKRKQESSEVEGENKKKKYDQLANAEVWRTFFQNKKSILNDNFKKNKKANVDNEKDRCKKKRNEISAPNPLVNLTKKPVLFQRI